MTEHNLEILDWCIVVADSEKLRERLITFKDGLTHYTYDEVLEELRFISGLCKFIDRDVKHELDNMFDELY